MVNHWFGTCVQPWGNLTHWSGAAPRSRSSRTPEDGSSSPPAPHTPSCSLAGNIQNHCGTKRSLKNHACDTYISQWSLGKRWAGSVTGHTHTPQGSGVWTHRNMSPLQRRAGVDPRPFLLWCHCSNQRAEIHTSDSHPVCTDRETVSLWQHSLCRWGRQSLSSGAERSLCSPARTRHWIQWILRNEPATVRSRLHCLHVNTRTLIISNYSHQSAPRRSQIHTGFGENPPEVHGEHHPFGEVVPVAPQADVHGAGAGLAVHAAEVERLAGEVIRVPTLALVCREPWGGEQSDTERFQKQTKNHPLFRVELTWSDWQGCWCVPQPPAALQSPVWRNDGGPWGPTAKSSRRRQTHTHQGREPILCLQHSLETKNKSNEIYLMALLEETKKSFFFFLPWARMRPTALGCDRGNIGTFIFMVVL